MCRRRPYRIKMKDSQKSDVTGRKEKLSGYGLGAVVISSIVAGALSEALSTAGGLKAGGGTGRCGLLRAWSSARTTAVLAAAPPKCIRIPFINLGFTRRNAPPLYLKPTLSNTQFMHSSPSSCCPEEFLIIESSRTLSFNAGTTGTDPSGGPTCAQVDVWIPKEMADAQQAPTINDPNASITLDIT